VDLDIARKVAQADGEPAEKRHQDSGGNQDHTRDNEHPAEGHNSSVRGIIDRMRWTLCVLLLPALFAAEPDWTKVNEETLRHYKALIQIDTTVSEAQASAYLKKVLEAEGIPVEVFAKDPQRPNVVARIKGNGSKRPVLIMAHTDVVGVQPEKWTHPPFSAAIDGDFVYGRGTIDDKDNVTAGLMTMLLLKRLNVPLDRDVIFLAEAGEEGNSTIGAQFVVNEHWDAIAAEYCIAEGGQAFQKGGKISRMLVSTTEKVPASLRVVAHGTSGHGSRPLPDNAIARLANALSRIAAWEPPMRLNDTTRAYFERLATISTPQEAARYNGLADRSKQAAINQYFRQNEPMHWSMLRTSISPTMLKAGFRVNVIPSEAEATLDVRALPDEDIPAFIAQLTKIANEPGVEIVRAQRASRVLAPPSSIKTEMFQVLENAQKRVYPGAITIPTMSTGASDKVYLQAKGVSSYGIGPLVDEEDAQLGFAAHSDQERLREKEIYRFTRFNWEVITEIAAKR
jgi:acetylornithine deacetylase/succinyl-diaminopimelate desuccinylase-like protein